LSESFSLKKGVGRVKPEEGERYTGRENSYTPVLPLPELNGVELGPRARPLASGASLMRLCVRSCERARVQGSELVTSATNAQM